MCRTRVDIPRLQAPLGREAHVLSLGSCFADEMAARLETASMIANPMGVLYNPESIRLVLELLMASPSDREQMIHEALFSGRDGRCHSWLGSSRVSGDSPEEAEARCLFASDVNLDRLDTLIITLGTDRCYRLRENNRVVANCHKEIAARFYEDECSFSGLRQVLEQILERYPRLHVVLTVSPYRYRKYGLHESQLSKARLLLGVDALCRELPRTEYFPAYEIVLDELRDYIYYKEDMLHPNTEAADYVFERLKIAIGG